MAATFISFSFHSLLRVKVCIIIFCLSFCSCAKRNYNHAGQNNEGIDGNNYLYPQESSRLRTYTFLLTDGTLQPDNYRQTGYLINGKFPGPPIFCNQFDFLVITVINRMTSPTTIHFHGLLQPHTVSVSNKLIQLY